MRRAAFALAALPLIAAVAPAAGSPSGRGFRAEVAALLVQGIAGGSLPVAAAAFPPPWPAAAGDEAAAGELPFLVEVAPPAPGEEPPAGAPPLEVYLYAVDAAGEVAAHHAAELARPDPEGEGAKLAGRLWLPPGGYSLRFLVFDPVGPRYGLAVREVTLGSRAGAPRPAEECRGWSVAGDGADGLWGLSARPVLVRGERMRLGAAPRAAEGFGGWRVRLEGPRRAPSVHEVPAAESPDGALEFEVPELRQGVYKLSLAGGEPGPSPAIEAWLVEQSPPGAGDCRRSWIRVLRRTRGDEATGAPPPGDEPRRSRRLTESYRQLLGRLAVSGELAVAARELAELEAPPVERDVRKVGLVQASEMVVVRELAERDARCLISLVSLHAEAYAVHYAAGRYPLATQSRRQAAAIAGLAAERLSSPEELALTAAALTGLAEMVEDRRSSLAAQRLLERALALDDDLEAARLLLAVSYERKGLYAEARRHFETLVARNSAHHEGRVRLAVLLRRMGEAGEAERLLRAVVAERPSAWLLVLSYQTLAQLLGRQERYAEAVETLELARRRLPGDQTLELMLAYALDRTGERRAAERLLAELPPAVAAASARYRYSDRPAAVGLLRETVRQTVTVRLPVLAMALRPKPASGEAP